VDRVEGYHRFVNKIWNAARFALMNLEDFDPGAPEVSFADLLPQERWVLTQLRETGQTVRQALDGYEFDKAAGQLYQFVWHEMCDWYIEMAKLPLYSDSDAAAKLGAQQTLVRLLDAVFRLLHPFMPFVTEELWQRLPWPELLGERPKSLTVASFPRADELPADEDARERIELVKTAVSAIRNVRGEMNVPPARKVTALAQGEARAIEVVRAEAETISALAGLEKLDFLQPGDPKPTQAAAAVVTGLEFFLPLAGLIDLPEEERRLAKEIEKLETERARIGKKLANPQFLAKAPEAVVAKEKNRAAEIDLAVAKLRENLARVLAAG
jgi:valyl-tRNA synthetase